MRILHARDFSVQPWKNGGGTTTEIAVSPGAAAMNSFDWRISMARVDVAGPFSTFPGIDRSLGLLAGNGLKLVIGGRGVINLKPGDHPAVFPGDVPVEAAVTSGAILDFNVMTRRGKWRHHLSRVTTDRHFEIARRGDITVALIRGSHGCAGDREFGDGDALLLDDRDNAIALTVNAVSDLWIADLWLVA